MDYGPVRVCFPTSVRESDMKSVREIMQTLWRSGVATPAFNIPYLPMMQPVVDALRDTGAFGTDHRGAAGVGEVRVPQPGGRA